MGLNLDPFGDNKKLEEERRALELQTAMQNIQTNDFVDDFDDFRPSNAARMLDNLSNLEKEEEVKNQEDIKEEQFYEDLEEDEEIKNVDIEEMSIDDFMNI